MVDHESGIATWMTRAEADEWYAEEKQKQFDASVAKHDTFAELLARQRKEAFDWLADKKTKEEGWDEATILREDSDDIHNKAVEGGYDDILDFLERNPLLTPAQVQELYDALNRRAGQEAVLEKMGEVDVFWETVTGSQEDIAQALDAVGQPVLAWIVRNPRITVRVGAAVATGGWSEVVAVPLDIASQLHEAQQRSLEENGRLMTSEELFGELGWAVGVEIIYEVGGHTVAAGLGKAAQVWRGLDEAGEAVVRQADELAESGLRQADELGESGLRQADDLIPVPPRGNEALGALKPGTRISDDLMAQTGYTKEHVEKLAEYARQRNIQVGTRSTNPYSAAHLVDGSAIAKPLGIKAKTVTDVDVLLGANPAHRGTVSVFPPKLPSKDELQKMSPDLREALEERYVKRLEEFQQAPTDLKKFRAELIEARGDVTDVRLFNGQVQGLDADGVWRNYGGDIDVVYLRHADGTPIGPELYDEIIEEMRFEGLIEHGGEMRVIEDVMRIAEEKGYARFSDEWTEALQDAIRLRENRDEALYLGEEIIVRMMPDGTLVRGEAVEELLFGRVSTDGY